MINFILYDVFLYVCVGGCGCVWACVGLWMWFATIHIDCKSKSPKSNKSQNFIRK
jgi:hypothetical protein